MTEQSEYQDHELGDVLRKNPIPETSDSFFDDIRGQLSQPTPTSITSIGRGRHRRYFGAIAAVAAAVLAVSVIAPSVSLSPNSNRGTDTTINGRRSLPA